MTLPAFEAIAPGLLAFPTILPWQIGLVIGIALHLTGVTVLAVRRGQPAWLGVVLGFLPGIGLGLLYLLPRDDTPDDELLTGGAAPPPREFSPVTMLTLLWLGIAAVSLMVRLFELVPDYHVHVVGMVDLWLFAGLAFTLVLGVTTRNPQLELIVQRAVIASGIFLALVVVIERAAVRIDVTAEQRYSLDPATRGLLQQLTRAEEQLNITYYYSPRSLRPLRHANLPREISELLEEYRRVAPDHIVVRMVEVPQKETADPDEDETSSLLDTDTLGRLDRELSEEEKRADRADDTEAERQRKQILDQIRRLDIEPVEEEVAEGGRRETVKYYSAFMVSYGQSGEHVVEGVTVDATESAAGRRAVDHANAMLTAKIAWLVESGMAAARPLQIEAFRQDETLPPAVRFHAIVGWHEEGGTVQRGDVTYLVSEIEPDKGRVLIKPVTGDSEPIELLRESRTLITIGFLEGHDERHAYGRLLRETLHNVDRFSWDMVDLQGGREPVPPAIDVLVVSPTQSPLGEREQYEIDQYLMRGGNLLVCYGMLDGPPPEYGQWGRMHPSWRELFEKYGVGFGREFVFDEYGLDWTMLGKPLNVTAIVNIRPGSVAAHPLSAGLVLEAGQSDKRMHFCWTTSVADRTGSLPDGSEVSWQNVIFSSDRAWRVPLRPTIQRAAFNFAPTDADGRRMLDLLAARPPAMAQFPLAAAIEGSFVSAYTLETIPPRPVADEPEMPDIPTMPPGFPGAPGGETDGDGDGDGNEATPPDNAPAAATDNAPANAPENAPAADNDNTPANAPAGNELPLTPDNLAPPAVNEAPDPVNPEGDDNDDTGEDEPQVTDADRKAHIAKSQVPGRIVAIGTNFIYPLSTFVSNTDPLLINAMDWLGRNDGLLGLRAKTTAYRPIDPSVTDETREWYGWMVTLVVPLGLALVALFVFLFGVQERWTLRARQQAAVRKAAGAISATGVVRTPSREPGVVAIIAGLILIAALASAWVSRPAFGALWLMGLLLATALIARGARIVFGK